MKTQKNWLEWSVFAVGLVLVCGTLGYLVYDAVTQSGQTPHLELTFQEVQPQSNLYLVPLTVHNHGGHTAEQVHVKVTLTREGQEPEIVELQVAYVPRYSNAHGFVAFKHDPRKGKLDGYAVSYEKP